MSGNVLKDVQSKRKTYSGAHFRVSTLIQASLQKKTIMWRPHDVIPSARSIFILFYKKISPPIPPLSICVAKHKFCVVLKERCVRMLVAVYWKEILSSSIKRSQKKSGDLHKLWQHNRGNCTPTIYQKKKNESTTLGRDVSQPP